MNVSFFFEKLRFHSDNTEYREHRTEYKDKSVQTTTQKRNEQQKDSSTADHAGEEETAPPSYPRRRTLPRLKTAAEPVRHHVTAPKAMNESGQRPLIPSPPPPGDLLPRRRRQASLPAPAPVQATPAPNGDRRDDAARPPVPPQQEGSAPCRDEEGDRGQKLPAPVDVFATPTAPRAPNPTESIDPGETKSSRSPTPPETTPGRRSSAGTKTPHGQHHPPLDAALGELIPTIYTARTQNQGSPTLPPPERQAEREETTGLARRRSEEPGSPSYRLRKGKG
jgi:hypothetical protein